MKIEIADYLGPAASVRRFRGNGGGSRANAQQISLKTVLCFGAGCAGQPVTLGYRSTSGTNAVCTRR